MENNDHGLLYDAAVAWKELTEYCYVFTFGISNNYTQSIYPFNLRGFHILQVSNI